MTGISTSSSTASSGPDQQISNACAPVVTACTSHPW
jgi:hypothetical protein